jgi:hypothetical protein
MRKISRLSMLLSIIHTSSPVPSLPDAMFTSSTECSMETIQQSASSSIKNGSS